MQFGTIKYILIMLSILAIIFISQNSVYRNQITKYASWVSNWAMSAGLSKVGGEVVGGGEALLNNITNKK